MKKIFLTLILSLIFANSFAMEATKISKRKAAEIEEFKKHCFCFDPILSSQHSVYIDMSEISAESVCVNEGVLDFSILFDKQKAEITDILINKILKNYKNKDKVIFINLNGCNVSGNVIQIIRENCPNIRNIYKKY